MSAKSPAERPDRSSASPGFQYHVAVRRFRILTPVPSIYEGCNLSRRFLAALLGKEYVVVAIAVERRVQVDEIDVFIRDVFPKDLQVITEIKLVFSRPFVVPNT